MADEIKSVKGSKVEAPVKAESPKKEKLPEPKIVLERVYIIPLKRDVVKTACYKRSNKAVRLIREFIMKHAKTDKVVIKKEINEFVWAHGCKNPPGKVKVKVTKDDLGKAIVSLEAL
ncbi:MAG TPA: 50S ribosomal protein L31e [Candidatus Nanoarchaeia archaeon]|nr:50S ribosomal protein L31e [Candidatus Nanoarchaeia archaeon]